MTTVRNDPTAPAPEDQTSPEGTPGAPAAPERTMEGDIAAATAAAAEPIEAAAPAPAPADTPAGDGAVAPLPAAAVEGGDGEGAVGSAAPPAPLPDHYDILGHKITPAQAEAALNVYAWASGLTPEQVQAVERALNPEPAAAGVQPPAAPAAPAQPDPYEDPAMTELRAQVAQQAAALEQLQAQRQPEVDQQLLQARTDVATDVMEKVRTTYDLNDAEQELLAQRVAASGMLPMYEQQTGDFRAALDKAVEQHIWTDPYYREKAIAQQTAAAAAQSQTIEERKAASSALGGSTGSAPRQTEAPPRPSTRPELIDAMAAEIAAAQNGQ